MKQVLVMGCVYNDTIIPLREKIVTGTNNFYTDSIIKRCGGIYNIIREFPDFIPQAMLLGKSTIFQSVNERTSFTPIELVPVGNFVSLQSVKKQNIGWIHLCYLDCIIDRLPIAYLKKLKTMGVVLSADLASRNINYDNPKMHYIDYFITSVEEHKFFNKINDKAIWIAHEPEVLSIFYKSSVNYYDNPYYVKKPKNVLGAGDVFSGWIIHETMRGMNLTKAVDMAQRMTSKYVKKELANNEKI